MSSRPKQSEYQASEQEKALASTSLAEKKYFQEKYISRYVKERNKKFIELIKATTYDYDEELSCLKQEPKDNSELFNKFHETNEVSVGERITNYLEAQKW